MMNGAVPRLVGLPRRFLYALIAVGLSAGAPVGLLVVRLAGAETIDSSALRRELEADPPTYAYVLLSTLVVFASFGYVLGRQADALVDLSRTDPLTGLGNTLAFEERLEQEAARSVRYGQPLALLLADVDGLKAINDRHGHRAGDLALQAVARCLRDGARQTDLAVRIGGDEFALLAPSTSRSAAVALGERIRSLVVGQGIEGLTVSLGVATLEPGRPLAGDYLREMADTALYEAKRRGRDQVVSA
jgi:diguanylate cyclase (GGDEF)-like protein